MTNKTKKIICATLASTLCVGVGLATALSPVSASADSYAQYGNSYVSGLGIQPTISAVLYNTTGDENDPSSFFQYRTNLDGYADNDGNYSLFNTFGTDAEIYADIRYAEVYNYASFDIDNYDTDYVLRNMSISSSMPSSPRFISWWQWDCWASFTPEISGLALTTDNLEVEFIITAYVRGTSGDENEPFLRSYTLPSSFIRQDDDGSLDYRNPLPDLPDFIASYPEILTVPHEDGGIAGFMGSITLSVQFTGQVYEAQIEEFSLNNATMSYNTYQLYESRYMSLFADVNTRYDIDPLSSIWNAVDGFFETEIFPDVTFGHILLMALGVSVLVIVLKIFLGG